MGTYNGVAGNIAGVTNPSISIPADGDSLAAVSVDAGLQKLTDYVAFLQRNVGYSLLTFAAQTAVPNTASTTYFLWLAGTSSAAPGTSSGAFGASLFPFFSTGRIVGASYNFSTTTVGGTTTIAVVNAGTPTTILSLPAGSSGGANNIAGLSVPVTGSLAVSVANGVGMTTSVGTIYVTLYWSLI